MAFKVAVDEIPDYIPVVFESHVLPVETKRGPVSMSLWDTAGAAEYDRIRPLAYSMTHVFLICYSITNRESFDSVQLKWMPELMEHSPGVPKLLIGCQIDARENNGHGFVSAAEGRQKAREIGAEYFVECSAVTGIGVNLVFRKAALAARRYHERIGQRKNCAIF